MPTTLTSEYKCYVSPLTRLYTEMGSVFVKRLVEQTDQCIVFTYNQAANRIKARNAKIIPAGEGEIVRVVTNVGSYEFGKSQAVRLNNNTAVAVNELQVGDKIQAVLLENRQGFIFARTGNSSVALHELVEADLFGASFSLTKFTAESAYAFQTFEKLEEAGTAPLYEVKVECDTKDDFSPASGHNMLLWPDGTSFGSGIFSF